jgi:hypothetical protein
MFVTFAARRIARWFSGRKRSEALSTGLAEMGSRRGEFNANENHVSLPSPICAIAAEMLLKFGHR